MTHYSSKIYFILWQGTESLTIIGPPGVEGYVYVMAPFVNKKYPCIRVIEVDEKFDFNDHTSLKFDDRFFSLEVFPCKSNRHVIFYYTLTPHLWLRSNVYSHWHDLICTFYTSLGWFDRDGFILFYWLYVNVHANRIYKCINHPNWRKQRENIIQT